MEPVPVDASIDRVRNRAKAAVMADLKKPEDDAEHIAAREKLIRARLGIGNHALIDRFDHFKPNKNVRFSTYMRKVVERWIYGNLRKHAIWE